MCKCIQKHETRKQNFLKFHFFTTSTKERKGNCGETGFFFYFNLPLNWKLNKNIEVGKLYFNFQMTNRLTDACQNIDK